MTLSYTCNTLLDDFLSCILAYTKRLLYRIVSYHTWSYTLSPATSFIAMCIAINTTQTVSELCRRRRKLLSSTWSTDGGNSVSQGLSPKTSYAASDFQTASPGYIGNNRILLARLSTGNRRSGSNISNMAACHFDILTSWIA